MPQAYIFKRKLISIERENLEMAENMAVQFPKQDLCPHSQPILALGLAAVWPLAWSGAAAAPACLHLPSCSSLCSGDVVWDTLLWKVKALPFPSPATHLAPTDVQLVEAPCAGNLIPLGQSQAILTPAAPLTASPGMGERGASYSSGPSSETSSRSLFVAFAFLEVPQRRVEGW